MAITFDDALGIHPDALNFRVQRTKVLASNLANVDTPGYLARDLSFNTVMSGLNSASGHQKPEMQISAQYAVPYQNSTTGNTVELGVEQAKFTQNNMDFQTSLTFLNMKFSGLAKAIEGR
ncbi:flagellar basal body rod protein FlgB [Vibrio sp. SM6]|uniref:Flagellar basal body rod protein FlgB n=1 Tax=Vibrio agarilyticus TaxID=2726741 RepID=A0A7X8YHP7_9VIBR|nr:flagellar basal body rod protein FlgB [Vibrio agarilyticus]NLS13736.1 flagellar basal body rod protein FlgB [Vibrio agarilyticus]